MKLIKMLGLAMVTSVMAMVLFGAGTAAAATQHICQHKGGGTYKECVEEKGEWHDLENGTTFKSNLVAGVKAELQGNFPVKCQKSNVEGKLTEAQPAQGNQIKGQITSVTWEECKDPFEANCTATAIQLPWSVHVEQQWTTIATGEQKENPTEEEIKNGTVKKIGNGQMWVGPEPPGPPQTVEEGLQPGAEIVCPAGTCVFKVKETQPTYTAERWGRLHIKGGKPATIRAKQMLLKRVSGSALICGNTGEWCAEYKITSIKQPAFPEQVEPTLWVIHRPQE